MDQAFHSGCLKVMRVVRTFQKQSDRGYRHSGEDLWELADGLRLLIKTIEAVPRKKRGSPQQPGVGKAQWSLMKNRLQQSLRNITHMMMRNTAGSDLSGKMVMRGQFKGALIENKVDWSSSHYSAQFQGSQIILEHVPLCGVYAVTVSDIGDWCFLADFKEWIRK